MEAKTFEIRDKATFLPALAVRLSPGNEADRYLLAREGYGLVPEAQGAYVVLWGLTGGHAEHDPNVWNDRTRKTAHAYIRDHWDELASGHVIDVEWILGESENSKVSESEIYD